MLRGRLYLSPEYLYSTIYDATRAGSELQQLPISVQNICILPALMPAIQQLNLAVFRDLSASSTYLGVYHDVQ